MTDTQDPRLVEALRTAVKETERLKEQNRRLADRDAEPIAIVGMSCRLPGGADDPQRLWELLAARGDALGPFPEDRGWDLASLFHDDPEHPGTSYTREGGFLPRAGDFDPDFFGITPREALAMDPQQRIALELAWESLESAGIDPTSLAGTDSGVYIGATASNYGCWPHAVPEQLQGIAAIGSTTSVISGRLAYTLGLEGPAVTIDTACSSSLYALYQATHALRRQECSLALAGGVTVLSVPGGFVEFSRQRALAPDGRCKAFAAAADGTGFSEGAGLLVLERLSDARSRGHPVLAVLRGGAANSDGASNGLTAPNGPSQRRVIGRALDAAGLAPHDVDAVEAHGTGTPLGDPIEARALLETYGRDRPPGRPLWLGSLKSNIGHTQAAAGAAGVIKMVLALNNGRLPATAHVDAPTPHVDWASGAVRLLTEEVPWPKREHPRRAGISAFGISGTNVHLLLEEAPEEPDAEPGARPAPPGRRAQPEAEAPLPWVLSAADPPALRESAQRLWDRVQADPAAAPADVGWSLATTRAHLEHRAVVVARDREDLLHLLLAVAGDTPAPGVVRGRARGPREVAFVFPGQGALGDGRMARMLDSAPEFAAAIAACEQALAPHLDYSITEVLRGAEGAAQVERPDVTQPALFAAEVALARLWEAHGVRPSAVVGHSQGEIAAAHVAGMLGLDDAARIVALRSRLLAERTGPGGMLAVQLAPGREPPDLARWNGALAVAAYNGPHSLVVSGDSAALEELAAHCAAEGMLAVPVPVGFAAHTPAIEALREELLGLLSGVAPRAGELPLYSTVTGASLPGTALDAEYWYRNVRHPVHLDSAIRALSGHGWNTFVEIAPAPVLTVGVQQTVESAGAGEQAAVLATLPRPGAGYEHFVTALAEAHVCGVEPDWGRVFNARPARRVALPTYPFQRRRYWIAAPGATTAPHAAPAAPEAGAPAEPEAAALQRRLAGRKESERFDVVLEVVREHWAGVLGYDRPEAVEDQRGFMDAGGSSMAAVQLRNRLNGATGQELPATAVFDHPTPAALARHLLALTARPEEPEGDPLAALEALELALGADGLDPDTRAEAVKRLRALAATLHGAPRRDTPAHEVEHASDEELFDLIDQEFGIS